MDTALTTLFLGTTRGAVFALVAMGLVLVWRGAGIVNFAQMGQAMFSTYIASSLIISGRGYWFAFATALIAGALLGALVDVAVMRPLTKRSHSGILASESMRATVPVIASLGILGILQSLAGMLWAAEERGFPSPVSDVAVKSFGKTAPFTNFDLFIIIVVLLTLAATTLFFTKTGMGLAMRATALNPEVARLSGIRIGRVRTLSWAISGVASSLAGLLITPSANLSPNTLDLILIVGFTAAVVGGLESLPGSVVGGFILGLLIAVVNVYDAPDDVFLALLIFLLVVLIVKPGGLFGSKRVRNV